MAVKPVWSGEIDATAPEGISTGIQLQVGDEVSILASGWIKYGREDFALAAPQGRIREGYKATANKVLGAKFSGSDKKYEIGNGVYKWSVPETGELILYVIDAEGKYVDNSGSFTAEVYK
ncbi:PA-IL family protein [Jejubacter calystegiae]|uniref:PA-IL family protein n=1 Tax=Jejubacter calystegiae TaxID=2579935 RepID=A0A4P8YF16_9ENTR|nr:LecA/PA-IL family lectin [Jejubacter calystegiae]QCT18413.1 PA-IL family protein [Jejubacter calystegiae]